MRRARVFYGLLGYPQGTAETISHLSHAPNFGQVALVFCAYVTCPPQ